MNKQAVLESGLGRLVVIGKKLVSGDNGSCPGAFSEKDGSSAGSPG